MCCQERAIWREIRGVVWDFFCLGKNWKGGGGGFPSDYRVFLKKPLFWLFAMLVEDDYDVGSLWMLKGLVTTTGG
jgi:hypothetical protein